jgi:hypothetical protein
MILKGTTQCISCTVGCKTCTLSDISACVGCVKGYYPAIDAKGINRCFACPKNCNDCNSQKVCGRCATGYVLSSDKTKCTLRCSDSCLTCEDNLPNKCLSCYPDGLLNVQASECESSLACNTDSSCTTCPTGYVLNNQKKCIKCNYATENCIGCTYDDLTSCARCAVGYYFSNKLCVKCESPCLACVTKGVCLSCTDGNYLVPGIGSLSGICKKCDINCKTCTTSPNQCTSCT